MNNFNSTVAKALKTINAINIELAGSMPHQFTKSVFQSTSDDIYNGQTCHSLMDYIVYRMKAKNSEVLALWEFEDRAWNTQTLQLPLPKNWRACEKAVHILLEEYHHINSPLTQGELIELSYYK